MSIVSFNLNRKLNVAFTFNVKPSDNLPLNTPTEKFNSTTVSTFNDTYAEWDTWETINAIKSSLELYHNVTMIEANEDAFEKFKSLLPDIVFNYSECANGISREAQIPAMLDMLKIPYTGSDPLTLITCLHKARTKEILTYHKIPNPKFYITNGMNSINNFDLAFPVIIKPIAEGSSKGIFNNSYIKDNDELTSSIKTNYGKYKQQSIVEEYLPGREFTVGILGNGDDAEVLPIVEMNFSELPKNLVPIYSFEAKWIEDTPEKPLEIFTCPAKLDANLEQNIKNTALFAYNTLNCKDWARIDVRLDANNTPNIIEVNPIPGALPNPDNNSCLPKAARARGLSYEEMINTVLFSAIKRHGLV